MTARSIDQFNFVFSGYNLIIDFILGFSYFYKNDTFMSLCEIGESRVIENKEV